MITFEMFQQFNETCTERNVWIEYQDIFHDFWNNKIMNDNITSLDDADIDPIIRMLDQNGKGNTRGSIVVAKAFIRMGMWYRAFRSLKDKVDLRNKFNQILTNNDDDQLINLLNEFETINKDNSNGLTGKNAVIINAILCLNNPTYFISAVSLEHRKRIYEYLYAQPFEFNSFGEKLILSNRKIINFFRTINVQDNPRKISLFIYSIKTSWENNIDSQNIIENISNEENEDIENIEDVPSQTFIIEKYLEDFLIGNWESTELGKKYDLLFENSELISQQYKTDIGIIDLLVKEKITGNYVVIELKRNQTSDVTVGQIMRYLGWIKIKLSHDKPVKGIIIGYTNDEKLNYAISCVENIEIFLYRVNFSLIKPEIKLT